MSEVVVHKRPTVVVDGYGNATAGPLSVVQTFTNAMVAPQVEDEPKLVGRTPIATNYNVYIRGAAPTGILPDDVLEVRGEDVPVDGRIASWSGYGGYRGDHIQVRLTVG